MRFLTQAVRLGFLVSEDELKGAVCGSPVASSPPGSSFQGEALADAGSLVQESAQAGIWVAGRGHQVLGSRGPEHMHRQVMGCPTYLRPGTALHTLAPGDH